MWKNKVIFVTPTVTGFRTVMLMHFSIMVSWIKVWTNHTMHTIRHAYKILARKPEGRDPLEDLSVDEKIILEWILGK